MIRLTTSMLALLAATVAWSGTAAETTRTAVFAGGCFWCVEEVFDKVDGVVETTSGYSGGHVPDPTYEQVLEGDTGHHEVVRVTYDPDVVGYEGLLDAFWVNVDPFDAGGQFCDRGTPYLSAIFVGNEEERRLAEESRRQVADRFDQEIATKILPAEEFYVAEEYHQDYYNKNPFRYHFYKWSCGRERRLDEIWGDERDFG